MVEKGSWLKTLRRHLFWIFVPIKAKNVLKIKCVLFVLKPVCLTNVTVAGPVAVQHPVFALEAAHKPPLFYYRATLGFDSQEQISEAVPLIVVRLCGGFSAFLSHGYGRRALETRVLQRARRMIRYDPLKHVVMYSNVAVHRACHLLISLCVISHKRSWCLAFNLCFYKVLWPELS